MIRTITIETAGGYDDKKYCNCEGCYLYDALRPLIKPEHGLDIGGQGNFYIYPDENIYNSRKRHMAVYNGFCPDFSCSFCQDAGELGQNLVRQVEIPNEYLV
jgi:hypothetical protein